MIEEHKVREFIAIAEAYGWKLAHGAAWANGIGQDKLCCPMGAVVVAVNGGVAPTSGGFVSTVMEVFNCSAAEVWAFATGFDDAASLGILPSPQDKDNYDLGRKIGAEIEAT